mgnify:CR=1 FL=1
MSSALTVIRQRALYELGVGGVIPNGDISAYAANTVTAIRWFGEVVIDAAKNPVIYLKRAAPVAKKLAEEAAKDPNKIITLAGVMTAAGGIIEYKVASVGVEKGIEIAKKAKKSMDESKLAEKKDEETTATPYYDETV